MVRRGILKVAVSLMLSSMVVQWGCNRSKDDEETTPGVPATPPSIPKKRALVVVDVQASFMALTGRMQLRGSLPVSGSEGLPERISKIIEWNEKNGFFDYIIFSQDYHDPGHISFMSGHNPKGLKVENGLSFATVYCRFKKKDARLQEDYDYCCSKSWKKGKSHTGKTCKECDAKEGELCKEIEYPLWPDHCVKGVKSLAFDSLTDRSPELEQGLRVETKMAGKKTIEVIHILKGTYIDRESFSMFADTGTDIPNGTDAILQSKGITELYFTGLATDFCVGRSALHALDSKVVSNPYKVFMFEDLMQEIFEEEKKKMKEKIEELGGEFITSSSFLLKQGADKLVDKWIAAMPKKSKMDKTYMENNLTYILADLNTTVEDLEGVLKASPERYDNVIRQKLDDPNVDKVLRKAGLKTFHQDSRNKAQEDLKALKKDLKDEVKVELAAYRLKFEETQERFNKLGLKFDNNEIGSKTEAGADQEKYEEYNTAAAVLYENIRNTMGGPPKRPWKELKKAAGKSHHREADVEENGKKPSHLVISSQE